MGDYPPTASERHQSGLEPQCGLRTLDKAFLILFKCMCIFFFTEIPGCFYQRREREKERILLFLSGCKYNSHLLLKHEKPSRSCETSAGLSLAISAVKAF